MGEMTRNLIMHQVSPVDGRPRLLHNTAGPTLGTFGAFGVRGFEIYDNTEPSPFELAIAETPTRLDLAPRVLWMDGCYPSLHIIWV
jgi:hypothetical protein